MCCPIAGGSQVLIPSAARSNTERNAASRHTCCCGSDVAPLEIDGPGKIREGTYSSSRDPAVRWLLSAWMHREGVVLTCPPGNTQDRRFRDVLARRCAAIVGTLAAQRANFGARNAPALVIVPAVVLPIWAAEFARWAPELNVVEYCGSAMSRNVVQEYEWSRRRVDQERGDDRRRCESASQSRDRRFVVAVSEKLHRQNAATAVAGKEGTPASDG